MVSVTVSPSTAAVDACRTVALSASVTGSVSQAGVYTAPAVAGVFHAVATSVAAPARTASATLTVAEHVRSVQVSPATAAIPTSGAVQLTAAVTTTCGSFSSRALLTPTGQIVLE